ncbi:MAG: Mut7-C RNAse domain-containing protein [Candidatus Bathyarchaeia archaeon]
MKFIIDAMLGKLARWLRMLGQDVSYSVMFSDNELLGLAKAEGRVLLTKDFELYKSAIGRGLDAFYMEGKTESSLLAEVANRYGLTLEINMDKSHCPACNTPLESAQKEQLKNQLQPNTYRYYDRFWRCPNCGQIYWQGAHWKQIQNTLEQARQKRVCKDGFGALKGVGPFTTEDELDTPA